MARPASALSILTQLPRNLRARITGAGLGDALAAPDARHSILSNHNEATGSGLIGWSAHGISSETSLLCCRSLWRIFVSTKPVFVSFDYDNDSD